MEKSIIALLLTIQILAFEALASKTSYSIDYIRGESNVEGVKIAFQYHTNYFQDISDGIKVYLESSLNAWMYGGNGGNDTNFVLAVSPVLQYPIGIVEGYETFLEFGIGASMFDDTKFAEKDVGGHFQFEDRLGIVMRFGLNNENQISLRYFHYSNGGLQKTNPGLDFIAFSFMRHF